MVISEHTETLRGLSNWWSLLVKGKVNTSIEMLWENWGLQMQVVEL